MNLATGAIKAVSTTISTASSLNPFSNSSKVTSQDKSRPKYKKGSGIHENKEVTAALSIQRWYRNSKDTKKEKTTCCGKFCSRFCCCCPCHKQKALPQKNQQQEYVVKHEKGAHTLLKKAKEKPKLELDKPTERPTSISSEKSIQQNKPSEIPRLSPMASRDVSPLMEVFRNNEFVEKTNRSPTLSPLPFMASARISPVKSPSSETTRLIKNK